MKKAPYLCIVASEQVKSRNTAEAGSMLIMGPARKNVKGGGTSPSQPGKGAAL